MVISVVNYFYDHVNVIVKEVIITHLKECVMMSMTKSRKYSIRMLCNLNTRLMINVENKA